MTAMRSTDRDYLDAEDPADQAIAARLEEIQELRREEARRRAIFPE